MLDYQGGIYILIERFSARRGWKFDSINQFFQSAQNEWGRAIVTGINSENPAQSRSPLKWERKPLLLWLGTAPARDEVPVNENSVPGFLRLLLGMGFDIKFLAADFKRSESFLKDLNHEGIETLDGDWFRSNWRVWLKEHAQVIDYIYFDQVDQTGEFLTVIQSMTRAATIYYLRYPPGDPDQTQRIESALGLSDVVLVADQLNQNELENRFPRKRLYRVPATENDVKNILPVAKDEAHKRIARSMEKASPHQPPRLIAFYLPQYHPIPENDEWWGEGFTEWRNVQKTEPLFDGHYQPHVPADLGYYDLREEGTRIAQAELARQYGVEGFCYYHYWFKGKRLLERPLADLVESGKPDFPFCVCWANEHWSRRWDGKDREILQSQEYSEEDDLEHIRYLISLFKDPRYIRVNGKPILLIYRAENIPDAARTAETWREEARNAGLDGLYLCRVESFVKGDPRDIGFDASIEFAPDWWNKGPQLLAESSRFEQADAGIRKVCETNYIHSYDGLADAMMAKALPAYTWMRCVTPSWDNWARRQKDASVFLDSTPEKYQQWLTAAVEDTNLRLHGEERLVFVNAWNEWAEGNHLEPDQKFGRAYLEATHQALVEGQISTTAKRLGAIDETRINRLSSQVSQQAYQLQEVEQQLNDVLASTSWRATLPLRWVKQRLIDLKQMIDGLR